jgi:hypothetical protein
MRGVTRLTRGLTAGGAAVLLLALLAWAAPASLASVAGVAKVSPAGGLYVRYYSPTIASTGSSVVITASDNRGDIDYWHQPYGQSGWPAQRVATGGVGADYYSPVIAWTGSSVVIAADSSSGLETWTQPGGGSTWTPQQVATGGYSSPAIAVGAGMVTIAAIDSSGNIDYWYRSLSGGGWSSAQQVAAASSAGSYSAPAIAVTQPGVVVASTAGGQMLSWHEDIGVTSPYWFPVSVPPVPGNSYQTAALTVTNLRVELAGGFSGGATVWAQPLGQNVWGPSQYVTDSSPAPVPPSAVIAWNGNSGENNLVVANGDPSGNLWSYTQGSGGWGLNQVASASANTYSAPQLAAAGTSMVMAAIDNVGDVDYWYEPSVQGGWNEQPVAQVG